MPIDFSKNNTTKHCSLDDFNDLTLHDNDWHCLGSQFIKNQDVNKSIEQQARDLLERMEVEGAQQMVVSQFEF